MRAGGELETTYVHNIQNFTQLRPPHGDIFSAGAGVMVFPPPDGGLDVSYGSNPARYYQKEG